MKYGIISDIHGNLEALEAALEAIDKEGVQKIICAGDLVGYGANPNECIQIVRKLNIPTVAGNHDWAVIGKLDSNFFNIYAQMALWWTKQNLTGENIKFLENMNLIEIIDETITLVHSSLYRPEAFEYIISAADAHIALDLQKTPIAIVGHSHIPITFIKLTRTAYYDYAKEIKINKKYRYLINVGSVGQPRDENPDACYCIYDSDEQIIRIERVKYDVYKASSKIKKAGLPEILAERLKIGA